MNRSVLHIEFAGRPAPGRIVHPMPRHRVLASPHSVAPRSEPGPRGDGIDRAAYRELSPEAREVFKEAQENILALNGSRIRALQELKAANEKIAELERKLEEAAAKLASRRAADAGPADAEPSIPAPLPRAGAAGAGAPPPSNAPPATITLCYATGWDDTFLHFQIDDQPWTSLPGMRMEVGTGVHFGRKVLSVPGQRMKFVLTNGLGKFDTPNPYGEPGRPQNYEVDGPGTYLLQGGHVVKLE